MSLVDVDGASLRSQPNTVQSALWARCSAFREPGTHSHHAAERACRCQHREMLLRACGKSSQANHCLSSSRVPITRCVAGSSVAVRCRFQRIDSHTARGSHDALFASQGVGRAGTPGRSNNIMPACATWTCQLRNAPVCCSAYSPNLSHASTQKPRFAET
jgi:hypothetical protein